jgi:outer membrane protein
LEVLNSNLNTIDSSLRMMRAMYTEGFVEKLDVDKLELGRSNIKTQMDKLEGTIEMLNNVMKMQLGIPMGDNLNLTNSLEELNALISLPELDQEAIKNRIEVQLMNQQLSLSQLDEKRYKVGRYPTVAAFAQHQQNTQRPEFNFFQSNLTPNNNFIPSTLIGVKVTATLFDGLSNRSKIREVVNNRVKMENDLENFKRFASMEFINAKISYYNNIEQWEQQKKNITLAKNIYDRTKVKYTEGLGTALEITQAETDLVSANTGYQTAINDVILSKINIKKSLGKKIIE